MESSQGATPVGTPQSALPVQECEQLTQAAPVPESSELPTQTDQHKNLSTAEEVQPLSANNQDALAQTLTLCTIPASSDYASTQVSFNQFGSYVCVSDASGHFTLVPSMVTAMQPVLIQQPHQTGQFPEEDLLQAAEAVEIILEDPQSQPKSKKSKAKNPPRKSAPPAIAPRPPAEPLPIIITIPDLSEYEEETPLPDQVGDQIDAATDSAELDDAVTPPVALKTKPKPFMKITKRLTKKAKEKAANQANAAASAAKLAHTPDATTSNVLEIAPATTELLNVAPDIPPDPCPATSQALAQKPPGIPSAISLATPSTTSSAIPSALEALMRIAKVQAEIISPKLPTPLQASTGIRPDSEVPTTTPAAQSTAYITTPTSSSRRKNHVRQLNFGESPDLPIASSQPIVLHPTSPNATKTTPIRSIRSDVPWDLALRNVLAGHSEDQNLFATPKGKAKRVKKVSPVAQTPPKPNSSNEKGLNSVKRTLLEPSLQKENQLEADKSPEQPVEEIDIIANECLEDSLPEIAISQPEMSPPMSFMGTRSLSCCREANSNEKAAASVLIEMANSNPAPANEHREEQPNPNVPILTQFTPVIPMESAQKHSVPPVYATPQKDPVMCEGHSSMSFGAWDGEIPRTPQIRLDVTNSNSPFQVSLTKGFRFLPAAESPSLPAPLTPSISGMNSNSSIDTPYVGFSQFSSILNTPR